MSKRSRRRNRQRAKPQQQKSKPSASTLLDICVPIYGEFGLARKAIEHIPAALGKLNPDHVRVYALDNGTPDWIAEDGESKVTPEEMAAPVKEVLRSVDKYFRVDINEGYPGGVNNLISKGRSPLVLILTADVFLQEGAIEAMVRSMDDPTVGVVGVKLLFPLDMESPHGPGGTVQHAGVAFDIRGKPYHVLIGWSTDHEKVNVRRDMAAVTGACLMTRRNLWNEIGGFDRRYGVGTFEDMDYCFSIRSLGKRVLYEPNAWGFHLVSGARLQGANQSGFNLPMNETVFRGKWAQMLAWDEWRYL